MGKKDLQLSALKSALLNQQMKIPPQVPSHLQLRGGGDLGGFGGEAVYNAGNGITAGVGGGGSYKNPALNSAFIEAQLSDSIRAKIMADKERSSWSGAPQEYIGAQLTKKF